MNDKEILDIVFSSEPRLVMSKFIASKELHEALIVRAYRLGKSQIEESDEYEPYMGWCDVDGCTNEASAGGSYYKDTGYWCLCPKHSQSARDGNPKQNMKQSSVDRENSRDKETGFLKVNK